MHPLVFLDFDETLVHTRRGIGEANAYDIEEEGYGVGDTVYQDYNVTVRPGVRRFLTALGEVADLYIYSAGALDYLNEALEATGLLPYVLDYFSLHDDNGEAFAELRLTRRPWLLVDNVLFYGQLVQDKLLMLGVPFDEENFVHVRDFYGHEDDRVLLDGGLLRRIAERILY